MRLAPSRVPPAHPKTAEVEAQPVASSKVVLMVRDITQQKIGMILRNVLDMVQSIHPRRSG